MAKQKRCPKCDKVRAASHFYRNRASKDGLQSYCKDCSKTSRRPKSKRRTSRGYTEGRRVEASKRLFAYLKKHPCVDCGEDDIVVLEFDHVRGKKEETVTKLVHNGRSWKRILQEIRKCDVRCANCHRRKTAERGSWWRTKA